MGTTLTGYPGAGTDNSQWNQGIGSLAAGLFPNPAAVAQAGYYGAEARRAQLQSLAATQEINAGNRAIRLLPGQQAAGPGQVQFMRPPGPNMPPIIAPASDLPMVGGQQQQPPPPQPSLGQTVAGAAAQAPTQPTQPVQAPAQAPPQGGPGGAPPPPLGLPNPATLADFLAPGNSPNPKGWGTTGTPPPASSPSPGAPPAPNTTTSNGQVPTDDQGSGPFHQGAVMSPDGGQKFAPPAGPNGSPASINFDLGTYAALQAAAGRNPEMAKVQLISYIQDAENRGIIPKGTAERMTANYGSSVYGTDVGSQTALAQTGMTVAGGIQQANIAQTGETGRKLLDIGELDRARGDVLVPTTDPNNPGASPIMVPRRSITGPTAGYEPSIELQRGRPTVVTPPGGGPPVNMPAATAMQPGPNQPTVPPQTSDQAGAQIIQQIMAEQDPVKRQQLIERYQSTMGMAPKVPVTAEEADAQRQVNYNADQRLYAQPQTGMANFGVTAPVMFTPQAQQTINERTYQLQSQSLRLRNDPAAAHEQAVQSLIADGTLQSPAEVNAARVPTRGRVTSAGLSGDTRIGSYQAPGQAKASDHMIVGLRSGSAPGAPAPGPGPTQGPTPAPVLPPAAPAPAPLSATVAPGPPPPTIPVPQAPAVSGPAPGPAFRPQRLPNPAIAPPAPPNPGVQTAPGRTMAGRSAPAPRVPPGALGPAPAGMANGITGTIKTGQRVVVRDGFLFPVQ